MTASEAGTQPSVCLIVPTLNPMPLWRRFLEALAQQTIQPACAVMVDSSSADGAREVAREYGLVVETIPEVEFNHGGTRRRAVQTWCRQTDVVVLMTQDAVLEAPTSLERLVAPFADPAVGAVYGRQLPWPDAGPIEAHARYFNYPPEPKRQRLDAVDAYGIKTAFFSNSWGAYRLSALAEVGGIPEKAICSEDYYVAAKLLEAGYELAYAADATVWHSHSLSLAAEFRRYFDIGVFHSLEPWILEQFGGTGGEGWRFVRSELAYLATRAVWRIPEAVLRSFLKIGAYRLGRCHDCLPSGLVSSLTAHRAYWLQLP